MAETANEGEAYQKLLFADDAARGFAFIELCKKKYDVILMNPPFGAASISTETYLQKNYPVWGKNILSAFFERMLELINNDGLVGAIFDRTVSIKSSYEGFRVKCFCGHITAMADTGWNVLDANVETTTNILSKNITEKTGVFFELLESTSKDIDLHKYIQDFKNELNIAKIYLKKSINFTSLPNSIIGYYFEDYLIKIFSAYKNISQIGFGARQGHALNSDKHFRLFYELIVYDNWKTVYKCSPYSLFYVPYRDIAWYKDNGNFINQDKSLRSSNAELQLKQGVGFGKRGEILDTHVLKTDTIFTHEGQAIPSLSKEDSEICLLYTNSILSQFIINTFCAQHKGNGYVNLIPIPKINYDLSRFSDMLNTALQIKRKWFALDETCLEFHHLLKEFVYAESLKKQIQKLQANILEDKSVYLDIVKRNDDFWLNEASIPSEKLQNFENYKSKRPSENLISIDGLTDETVEGNPILSYEIISNLLGIAIGRWDIRSVIKPELIPEFGDFFDPLPFMPVVSLKGIPKDYPFSIHEDGILVEDNTNPKSLEKAIINVINKIWPESGNSILNELLEIGNINSLVQFFSNPSGFFDFHYKRYTKSRREAPIYWPISTASGSYTIWLYYPKLTDQTLVAVINNYLQPKIDDVIKQKKPLELNSILDNKGLKELKELNDFEYELDEMKKELLRITALPYKPNHDDGVIITAAPLHKLFRHTKWRKATEDCWKEIENGEYDWSHLAYSIWPERVTKKCKKDLSMAIAHGIENICEVKPKEKKEKAAKVNKKINPINELNFGE